MKRAFDIVFAGLAAIVLMPMFAIVAAAVWLDSGPPILFRQVRVGRAGKHFRILKFRSMVVGAEEEGHLSVHRDRRVTRVGRILRRYKLDELPQVFNVIKGEMSIVGPRPEVPEYVDYYSEEDRRLILAVRPGITDKASLEYRDESRLLTSTEDAKSTYVTEILPEKLRYYRDYVRTRTMVGDFAVIVRTALRIFR